MKDQGRFIGWIGFCIFSMIITAYAIPGMISYQGKVSVSGQPFTGDGYFRFQIVNGDESVAYWSNDGNNPPVTDIPLNVEDGIFHIQLGDTVMMNAIPSSVFQNNNLYLKIWFDDGTTGMQMLAPNQQITSAAFSYVADRADNADDSDRVDGQHYDSNWPTTLSNIQSVCGDDFHDIGGVDDDQPDDDSEVPDSISINNGGIYSMAGTGVVGIGTTSPMDPLHVMGSARVVGVALVDGRVKTQTIEALSMDGLELTDSTGTTLIKLNHNGNVGIRTDNPIDDFHVYGDTLCEGGITVRDSIKAYNTAGIRLQTAVGDTVVHVDDNGNVGIGTIDPARKLVVDGEVELMDKIHAGGPNGLAIATDDGITRLQIADSGNVGVGSWNSNALLNVDGDIRLDHTVRAADSSGLNLATDEGTSRLCITDTGNVGIGTTSPDQKLEVNGAIRVDDTILAGNNNGLTLTNNEGEAGLYISDDLNVGIGVTNPTQELHIAGDILLETIGRVFFANTSLSLGSSYPNMVANIPGDFRLNITDDFEINSTDFIVDCNNVRVGIRTGTPETELHVNGDLTVDDTIIADDSGGLKFASYDGTVRMTLDSGGDFGIGTTSPGSHRLSVESSSSGVDGSTGYFYNTNSSGIALQAE
ncbi:hypothetical protein JW979_01450, partial [bacterium]|nr:hypothetical protein [candidate division CSSED10-310 bacterium]